MLRIETAHIHIILYFMHAFTVSFPTPQPCCTVLCGGLDFAIISASFALWPVGSASGPVMRLSGLSRVSGSAKWVVWCEFSLGFHSEYVVAYTYITESLLKTVIAFVQVSYFETVQLFSSYCARNYLLL